MALGESLFDVFYLCVVIGLGVRLLFTRKEGAKLFGWMAVLLGAGDAFHLIPRILSHMSPGGFGAYERALSMGQFVTSITMTIFYVLFYFYYKAQSGDSDKKKMAAILVLAAVRIVCVLLPQNGWGSMPGDYTMGIVRNIPFAIMGILLILWTYRHRHKAGLQYMSLLIFLSFAFYIPVVLWADTRPAVGALMMPKTLACVGIVVVGFRHFVPAFGAESILDQALTFGVMGLVGGVWYREFTKFFGYTAPSHLSKLHVHTLALGLMVLLIAYLFVRTSDAKTLARFRRPFYLYNIGLVWTLAAMLAYGIYDVVAEGAGTISEAALSGVSGMGHILLGVGLIWLFVRIKKGQRQIA